jgi:hypothetical protein
LKPLAISGDTVGVTRHSDPEGVTGNSQGFQPLGLGDRFHATALLLTHVAAWEGTAVTLAAWLRIGVGVVGLALLAIGHLLRMRVLADHRPAAEASAAPDRDGMS